MCGFSAPEATVPAMGCQLAVLLGDLSADPNLLAQQLQVFGAAGLPIVYQKLCNLISPFAKSGLGFDILRWCKRKAVMPLDVSSEVCVKS